MLETAVAYVCSCACCLARLFLLPFAIVLGLVISWRFYRINLIICIDSLDNKFLSKLVFKLTGNRLREIETKECILITGATSGIGLVLAKHLYRRGYSIVAAYYDSNEEGYAELKRLSSEREIGGSFARKGRQPQNLLFLVKMDVRDAKSVASACLEVSKKLDDHKLELYGLINNAGLGSLQPFVWLERKTMRSLVETNLLGNLIVAREFLPLLARPKGEPNSRLVFVSSGLGLVPGDSYATYGVTKVGQIYLSKCLNRELSRMGLNIQSIAMLPHNFIRYTKVAITDEEKINKTWQELKASEKRLYKRRFDEHANKLRQLENVRNECTRRANATATATPPRRTNLIANFLASLTAQNVADTIETSGLLECFESALRLERPPEQMFAGDIYFQLLVGSILQLNLGAFLSDTIERNLYS